VAFAVAGRDTWVFLDGRTYVVSDPDDSPRRSRIDEQGALTAPMPATVLKVNVVAGQAVKRNDVVMVLEAMKMELPVRSPRDGVVKAIRCAAGELVQPGTTLLELEDVKIDS
jgi:biotin carboxyl carrier protein